MADAQDRAVNEEIDTSRAGTTNQDAVATAEVGEGDDGSPDVAAGPIATRPDLIVGTRRFELASLVATEGYNRGWCARAGLAFGVPGGGASRIDVLAALADRGLSPGRQGKVNLRVEAEGNDFLHDRTIRTWPCMVHRLVPLDSVDDTRAICRLELVDPIGYLASREIWGAFRDVSAAELIGGAIALAAGVDAGPTTEVATAYLPRIIVRPNHRDALDVIPYAIATGEALGEWVARVLGMLGLRAELFAEDGGDSQVLYLTDALAHRGSYAMHVERDGVHLSDDEQARDGGISIRSKVAFPGNPLRGTLLDDSTQGTPRVVAGFGSIGRVVRAQGADIDEATERAWHEVRRGHCESLMVRVASGHPGIEPGCTITLNETINRIDRWQVASARHLAIEGGYDNDATLLRADTAWHPPESRPRGAVIVSAMVDHSDVTLPHATVPRDRLGRINVRFSCLPPPNAEVAYALVDADTDGDGRIALDDYDGTTRDDYTANAAQWDATAQRYESGEYDDPYPGASDGDLTDEQRARREDCARQRREAITYICYKRLVAASEAAQGGPPNGSQSVEADDQNPTAGAAAVESTPGTHDESSGSDDQGPEQQAPLGDGGTQDGGLASGGTGAAEQHGEGIQPPPPPRRFPNPAAEADMLETPTPAEDRWPPRIAVPVVEPMAGAMHSFLGGHRQGDLCRVAVHDPFTAEVVGFQYRDNRPINRDVVGAAAAIVVEHNFNDAWSGIVLRSTEDMVDAGPIEAGPVEATEDAVGTEDAKRRNPSDEAPEAPAILAPHSLS